jgi:hypothetical protein
MTTTNQNFETKVTALIAEAMNGSTDYLLDWFEGTLFIEGVNADDIINIKNKVETFTDMMFSKVGDDYAVDFC